MFDFSAGEIAIIGTVALLVLGPEQLPKVARTIGKWTAKGQRYVQEIKGQMQQEIDLTALKQTKDEMLNAAQTLRSDFQAGMSGLDLNNDFDRLANQESQGGHHQTHESSWQTPICSRPRKRLRNKRTTLPYWYKQTTQKRQRVQSGAARMKRYKVDSSQFLS